MTEKNIWNEIINGENKQNILEFLKLVVCLAIMLGIAACLLNTTIDSKLNNIPCDKIDNPSNLGLTLNSSIDNICNYTFINTASYYKYHGIDGVLNISFNGFLEGYQKLVREPFLKLGLISAFLLFLMSITAIPELEKRVILSIKRKVSFIESALIKTIFILLLFGICLLFSILIPIIYCIICIFVFCMYLYGLFVFIIPAIIGLYWYNYKYMNSIKYNKKNKNNKKISKKKNNR